MDTPPSNVFRVLAGLLATVMACSGMWLAYSAVAGSWSPWYKYAGTTFGQLLFAWAFGAYALGVRGPFNWRGGK